MATAEARRKEDEASRTQEASPSQQTGHSRRSTRQLDFFQAMSDFKNMFPTLDDEVIEAVLRANDGAVDATIDQLLTMTIDEDMSCVKDAEGGTTFSMPEIPKYDDRDVAAGGEAGAGAEDSPPSYSEAMRTPGPADQTQSIWTTPIGQPKLPSRNQLTLHVDSHSEPLGAMAKLSPTGLPGGASAGLGFSPTTESGGFNVQRTNTSDSQNTARKREYRNWNPPMLGNLPDNFLRLMLPDSGPASAKSDNTNVSATSGVGVMSLTDARPKVHKSRSKSEKVSRSLSMGTKDVKDKDSKSRSSEKKSKSSEKLSRSFSLADGSHKSSGARHKDRHGGLSPQSQSRNHTVTIETHDFSKDMLQQRMKENERRRRRTSAEMDPELARYLEDERLALALQNSEFLQELRSNDDFMKTLEKESVTIKSKEFNNSSSNATSTVTPAPIRPPEDVHEGYGDDSAKTLGAFPFSQPVSKDKDEDAELRQQLSGMGKASKKQLASLARKFFKRKKKSSKQILSEQLAPSMMNLLEDDDEEEEDDVPFDSRYGNSPPEIEPLPSSLIGVPSHRTVQRPSYRPEGVTTYFDNKNVDIV